MIATHTFDFTVAPDTFAATAHAANMGFWAYDGVPPGCLYVSLWTVPGGEVILQEHDFFERQLTWEDLGVPRGGQVQSVQLTGSLTRLAQMAGDPDGPTVGMSFGPYEVYDADHVLLGILWPGRTLTAQDPGVSGGDPLAGFVDCGPQSTLTLSEPQSSGDTIYIRLYVVLRPGGNRSSQFFAYVDRIGLSTTYTPSVTATAQLETSWNVYRAATASSVLRWSDYEITGAESDLNWTILGNTASATLDSFWYSHSAVGTSLDLSWDQQTSPAQSFTAQWSTSQLVRADGDLRWSSSRTVGGDLLLAWRGKITATADLVTTWSVRRRASATLVTDWVVNEQTTVRSRDPDLMDLADRAVADILAHRGPPSAGHASFRAVEAYGGVIIEPIAFEPDPVTHRDEYYIHAGDNRVYVRVWDRYEPDRGLLVAHWQGHSQ